ncbi:hypothetical protein [Luteimonas vadosa]|uniref:DUF3108 domain-containing protein n=1 Tax=Luteimonas vadosa TaxID=1165507 RepID=A0ABP9DWX9_9GAMM
MLATLVLVVCCGHASAALLSVRGDARDPASERLLYREEHLLREAGGAPQRRLVTYRCPDGTAFARKEVDYRGSAMAPAFGLVDARDGHREGLRRSGTTVSVYSGDKRARLDAGGPDGRLVADAGFDVFLRHHWDDLLARRAVTLRFAVPAYTRDVAFKVHSLGAASIDGAPVQAFRLQLGGLLSLVSPRIDVAYDARTRELRRYTGVTNIRSDAGKPLTARIDFATPAQPADETRWHSAHAEPLTRCKLGA